MHHPPGGAGADVCSVGQRDAHSPGAQALPGPHVSTWKDRLFRGVGVGGPVIRNHREKNGDPSILKRGQKSTRDVHFMPTPVHSEASLWSQHAQRLWRLVPSLYRSEKALQPDRSYNERFALFTVFFHVIFRKGHLVWDNVQRKLSITTEWRIKLDSFKGSQIHSL